jgi:hypothetical protein
MERTIGTPDRPERKGQSPGSTEVSQQEDARKQTDRQGGGRDDAGDDEDVGSAGAGGVESP